MKITRHIVVIAAAASCCPAHAALYDRGGGLIYDDVLSVTWLQDANYAKTSGYDTDGAMTRDASIAWADQLVFGGFSDWRLPTLADAYNHECVWGGNGTSTYNCGYNITSPSVPIAHLYYESLGNLAFQSTTGESPQNGWGLTNVGPFINLLPTNYWYGTPYVIGPMNNTWMFNFEQGLQTVYGSSEWYAWAIRDGDVATVPTPPAFILMLTGLGILGITIRSTRKASY